MLFDDHGALELGNREAMAYYNNLMTRNFYFINHSPDKTDSDELKYRDLKKHQPTIILGSKFCTKIRTLVKNGVQIPATVRIIFSS